MAGSDASALASGHFHFVIDGQPTGPHAQNEIEHLIATRKIDRHTLVWQSGMNGWEAAGTMSAFLRAFPKITKQPLPPPLPLAGRALTLNPSGERASQTSTLQLGESAQPSNSNVFEITLPQLAAKRQISMAEIRDPKEKIYLWFILAANLIFGLLVGWLSYVLLRYPIDDKVGLITSLAPLAIIILTVWFIPLSGYFFLKARLLGNSVEVGPDQYPQIYSVIKQASEFLSIPMPHVFVMQGHGWFELLLAKRFVRNGMIILTSNLIDEFAKRSNSREFMMVVGRQLGHIKAGHFRFWFFKDIIGRFALFFHSAWRRHCHITADRIGLLCAGDLYAAEQALLMITVGASLAPGTNFAAIQRQRELLGSSFRAWFYKIFSTYPYTVVRLVRLREFAVTLGLRSEAPNAAGALGVLPIHHTSLRSMPVLIIHGHDRMALLELQNLLLERFPNVVPRVMVSHQHGTLGMSEKFDLVAGNVLGAIALMTPDDKGAAIRDENSEALRARQNVVMEVGWAWGKLGRHRCLLLKRGDVEIPSDLAGADVNTFERT